MCPQRRLHRCVRIILIVFIISWCKCTTTLDTFVKPGRIGFLGTKWHCICFLRENSFFFLTDCCRRRCCFVTGEFINLIGGWNNSWIIQCIVIKCSQTSMANFILRLDMSIEYIIWLMMITLYFRRWHFFRCVRFRILGCQSLPTHSLKKITCHSWHWQITLTGTTWLLWCARFPTIRRFEIPTIHAEQTKFNTGFFFNWWWIIHTKVVF